MGAVVAALDTALVLRSLRGPGASDGVPGERAGRDIEASAGPGAAPRPSHPSMKGRLPCSPLFSPKASLERATLELFDAADLTSAVPPTETTTRRSMTPASTGCVFLRPQEIPSYSSGDCSTSHHRPRLDHGNRCRGRVARRAEVLQGDHRPGAGGARGARGCALAVGHRPAEGVRISTSCPP